MQYITIDFETEAIQPRPDYPPKPVGVAIKVGSAQAQYFAWSHPEGNNCTFEEGKQALAAALAVPGVEFQAHNTMFEGAIIIEKMGLEMEWHKWHDTMVLAFLTNPHGELSLKPLCEKVLGMPPEERDAVRDWLEANGVTRKNQKDWGAYISKAPGDLVGKYAEGDVERTAALFDHLYTPELLTAYQREMALMPHIYEMEKRGVNIDVKRLSVDIAKYQAILAILDEKIKDIVGPIDIDSGEELANAIEAKGLAGNGFALTEKGNRSVAKESIIEAITDPQLLGHILCRRAIATTLRTFLEPWYALAKDSGKLYIKWNQVRNYSDSGARTGRISSSPNFQAIPVEWEGLKATLEKLKYEPFFTFPSVRSYVTPEKGNILISRDYCFHPSTEFLTEEGFKFFKDISNEKLAYWDNGVIAFEKPLRRIEQHFDGDLLHVHGRASIDVLATPEHQMVMLKRDKTAPYKVQLQDVPFNFTKYGYIPQAGTQSNVIELEEAKQILIAAYQADGSYKHDTRCIFKFSKTRKIERLLVALDTLGLTYKLKYYRYAYDSSEFTWIIMAQPTWLLDYVQGEKKLFTPLALTLPASFLSELFLWDGNGRSYFTGSYANANIIQQLAITRGLAANLVTADGKGFGKKKRYTVSIHTDFGSYTKTQTVTKVPYTGNVVCFEMPHSTLITRRNGKVVVAGNCAQELRLLAHFAGGGLLAKLQEEPEADVHMIAANIANITRKVAKTLGFAVLYGAGVAKIAEQLGISVDAATKIKQQYLAALPEINGLQSELKYRGQTGDFLTTLGGRRYYAETPKVINGQLRTFAYKLTNYLIQGSAADQAKQALLDYAQNTKHGKIVISCHDEIVIECPIEHQDEEAAILEIAMNTSFQDVLEYKIISTEARGFNFAET